MNTTFLDISVNQFQILLLVFTRTIGIVAVAPVFGHRIVLSQAKAGLALALAIVLYPAIPITLSLTVELIPYAIAVVKELIMGTMIGFVARLIFFAVQFAGEVIGIDVGFGVVNIIDPLSSEQISIIGTFKNLIAVVVFLLVNGHHVVLQTLAVSFEMVPLGGMQFTDLLAQGLIQMTSRVFVMAAKLAAPVIAALFLTSLALGITARTVPQMNVFVVGFPLKIGIGMGVIMLSLPFFNTVLMKFFAGMGSDFSILLQQMYKP